jgi:hypothetical protein
MAEKQYTTRIADLPENITMSMQSAPPQYIQQPINTRQPLDMNNGENNFTYTQMNVHPNPYGHPAQPGTMPLPQQPNAMAQNGFFPQGPPPPQQQQLQMPQQTSPQYRLPSRDIPRDTDSYMQDIEVTANYIPAPKLTSDYIRDFQEDDEVAIKNHKVKKHRERLMDSIMTEIQIPIFIGILFFIFQMPLIDALIFKRFSFMRLYNTDGNFNFYNICFIRCVVRNHIPPFHAVVRLLWF